MSMNVTANTPQPKPSRGQSSGCGTWIFLLIMLAGPGRSIVLALLGPHANNPRVLAIGAAVVIFAVAIALASRAAASTRRAGPQMPTLPGPPVRGATPIGPREPYRGGAPRFEPIITGTLVITGMVLLLFFAGAFLLLWLYLLPR